MKIAAKLVNEEFDRQMKYSRFLTRLMAISKIREQPFFDKKIAQRMKGDTITIRKPAHYDTIEKTD